MPHAEECTTVVPPPDDFDDWCEYAQLQLWSPEAMRRVDSYFKFILDHWAVFDDDVRAQLSQLKQLTDELRRTAESKSVSPETARSARHARIVLLTPKNLDVEMEEPHQAETLDEEIDSQPLEPRTYRLALPRLGPWGLVSELNSVIEFLELSTWLPVYDISSEMGQAFLNHRASLAQHETERGNDTRPTVVDRWTDRIDALNNECASYRSNPLLKAYRAYLENPQDPETEKAILTLRGRMPPGNAQLCFEHKLMIDDAEQLERLIEIASLKKKIKVDQQVSACVRRMSPAPTAVEAAAQYMEL